MNEMTDIPHARVVANAGELFNIVNGIWEKYSPNEDKWRKLAFSMSTRLTMCLLADGYWTSYRFLVILIVTASFLLLVA